MSLPLLLDPVTLQDHLADEQLLLVDLSAESAYLQGHIPGAVHINTADLILGEKPAPGRLPPIEQLNKLFSSIALSPEKHVVCYDNEGGPWAGRLIWTLDLVGHSNASFLNGGLAGWIEAGGDVETRTNTPEANHCDYQVVNPLNVEIDELLGMLTTDDLLIWDARSPEEYNGDKVLAQRGGHIPGAINCNWLNLLDEQQRLRPDLCQYLSSQGITGDKNIVTHCQTHRRSGLTYLAAKVCGLPRVRAYAGSWSEWGNRTDTPVEH